MNSNTQTQLAGVEQDGDEAKHQPPVDFNVSFVYRLEYSVNAVLSSYHNDSGSQTHDHVMSSKCGIRHYA